MINSLRNNLINKFQEDCKSINPFEELQKTRRNSDAHNMIALISNGIGKSSKATLKINARVEEIKKQLRQDISITTYINPINPQELTNLKSFPTILKILNITKKTSSLL